MPILKEFRQMQDMYKEAQARRFFETLDKLKFTLLRNSYYFATNIY